MHCTVCGRPAEKLYGRAGTKRCEECFRYVPTPAQIEDETRAIRAGWNDDVCAFRAGLAECEVDARNQSWTPPVVRSTPLLSGVTE